MPVGNAARPLRELDSATLDNLGSGRPRKRNGRMVSRALSLRGEQPLEENVHKELRRTVSRARCEVFQRSRTFGQSRDHGRRGVFKVWTNCRHEEVRRRRRFGGAGGWEVEQRFGCQVGH